MEKGCNFRTRPPGSTIWKGRLRYCSFLWASTVGQPQLPHVFWRFRATVDERKKSGDHQLIRWKIYHLQIFTGFLFTSQVVIAGFLNHQQYFGWKFGGTPVFSNQKWWKMPELGASSESNDFEVLQAQHADPKRRKTCRWWLQMVSSMAMLQND